jgi:hypothetical protein
MKRWMQLSLAHGLSDVAACCSTGILPVARGMSAGIGWYSIRMSKSAAFFASGTEERCALAVIRRVRRMVRSTEPTGKMPVLQNARYLSRK